MRLITHTSVTNEAHVCFCAFHSEKPGGAKTGSVKNLLFRAQCISFMIDEPFKSHPVASPPSEGHLGTSAPGAPSAAPCERRWIAGCGRSRTAPSAQRR